MRVGGEVDNERTAEARAVQVRRLRDNVSAHLAGLNEDNAEEALVEAAAVLEQELVRTYKALGYQYRFAVLEVSDDDGDV